MNNGKFFAGLALGALVGSALSCFAHSNRGRKLRRDVYDAIQDLQEDAKDLAHHAKHKAEEVSSEVAGKVPFFLLLVSFLILFINWVVFSANK